MPPKRTYNKQHLLQYCTMGNTRGCFISAIFAIFVERWNQYTAKFDQYLCVVCTWMYVSGDSMNLSDRKSICFDTIVKIWPRENITCCTVVHDTSLHKTINTSQMYLLKYDIHVYWKWGPYFQQIFGRKSDLSQ